jgi:hypothetical protein
MNSIEAWDIFSKSGNIFDYLVYIKVKLAESNKKAS